MRNQKHLRQVAVRSVRASQFNFDDTNLRVSGYVNETGKPSDPIPNWGETDEIPEDEEFVEVMQPGVFRDAIKNADFVDFYLEHKPGKYLSSTREGTLQLSEDSTGLKMSASIVPTSWGQDTYTLIKNNVIKSMSFGFIPIQDKWDLQGDTPVRTVTKLQLLEVSAVRFPAYPDSSIAARRKHFKRLNQMLEKRGLTLKTIHERGVNHMVKSTKDVKKRASGAASNNLGSADVQNLVSALGNLSTSIDNNTNAVQENSEVQKNIAAAVMQASHGDRSKKEVHKTSKKRDGEAAKTEKPAEPKTEDKSKATKSTEKPKETPKKPSETKTAEKPKETGKGEKSETKETPKKDAETKAKAEKEAKSDKRSKKAADMMANLKSFNETV